MRLGAAFLRLAGAFFFFLAAAFLRLGAAFLRLAGAFFFFLAAAFLRLAGAFFLVAAFLRFAGAFFFFLAAAFLRLAGAFFLAAALRFAGAFFFLAAAFFFLAGAFRFAAALRLGAALRLAVARVVVFRFTAFFLAFLAGLFFALALGIKSLLSVPFYISYIYEFRANVDFQINRSLEVTFENQARYQYSLDNYADLAKIGRIICKPE